MGPEALCFGVVRPFVRACSDGGILPPAVLRLLVQQSVVVSILGCVQLSCRLPAVKPWIGRCAYVDAPLMAFHYNVIRNLLFRKRPALVTHTNDISIHFQTFKDHGVIFATSNTANDDYIKAYIEEGQVFVEYFIERSGREVRE